MRRGNIPLPGGERLGEGILYRRNNGGLDSDTFPIPLIPRLEAAEFGAPPPFAPAILDRRLCTGLRQHFDRHFDRLSAGSVHAKIERKRSLTYLKNFGFCFICVNPL